MKGNDNNCIHGEFLIILYKKSALLKKLGLGRPKGNALGYSHYNQILLFLCSFYYVRICFFFFLVMIFASFLSTIISNNLSFIILARKEPLLLRTRLKWTYSLGRGKVCHCLDCWALLLSFGLLVLPILMNSPFKNNLLTK